MHTNYSLVRVAHCHWGGVYSLTSDYFSAVHGVKQGAALFCAVNIDDLLTLISKAGFS